MEAKLLIVEDEANLRGSLQDYFRREGFEVVTAGSGAEALQALGAFTPDLAILDVELPDVGNWDLCQTLRRRLGATLGIIMISGVRKETAYRVVGLEMGADAYLLKPFETVELLAQVRALWRRLGAQRAETGAGGWISVDEHLRIHLERRAVEAGGRPAQLTQLEFDLLAYLVQHPGKACSRGELLDEVWDDKGAGESYDAAVNTCVTRLRTKIEPAPSQPRYIQSVHGVGYRFMIF